MKTTTKTESTRTNYTSTRTRLTNGRTRRPTSLANPFGVYFAALFCFALLGSSSFAQNVLVNPGAGTYPTLKGAFDAINAGTHTGAVTISVILDTTETAAAVLNASGTGSASYTSVSITPVGPRTISGSLATPLIDLNGADNVTIDGLNAAGNSLVISNSSIVTTAGTSTIRFIADASSNIVQNATINGAATGGSTGNIIFSTATTTGNDNNTITACNIGPVGATFPTNSIFSSGTTTSQATRNSGIQITNNNIFDFFNNSATIANGILASGSTDWTITGNSFYQTATRTFSVAAAGFIGISISDTSGINFVISNNFVGGSAASAGGTAWTQTGAVTHTFIGIRMSVGTATPSSLQNNTIRNLSISTSTTSAINAGIAAVTGAMNVGTTTGNTIGSTTGTGSVTWTGAGAGAQFAAILAGTGTPGGINISNNNIGSVTIAGAGTTTFYGIRIQGAATAAYTISGNTIGSTTTANSITSNSNTTFVGISGTQTAFAANVTNNTLQNLQHTSTGTSASLRGIELTGSVSNQNISANTIRDFSTASTNTGQTSTSAIAGIVFTGSSTSGNTITANTMRDLASTTSGATAVYANGIVITSTPGTTMGRNFIFNLTAASTSTTSSIVGIHLFNSSASETIQNNMIRLGTGVGNNPIIRGIYDNSTTASPTTIRFNSVFIGGTQGANVVNTSCINRVQTSTMDIRDNILWNNRASTGAPGSNAGRHYCINSSVATTAVTTNFNNLFADANGGTVGFSTSDRITLANWQAVAAGFDTNSFSANPSFVDATNATAPDLHLTASNPESQGGQTIAAVTDDFDGQTRPQPAATNPDIGADEGTFTVSPDLLAPAISYTALGNTGSLTSRTVTGFATITDNSGAVSGGSSNPRIYYKKSTDANAFVGNTSADNGWKFTSATNSSSPYDFTLDYSILNGGAGSVVVGTVIQYFVVAQDAANNLGSNPAGAAASGNPPVENINSFTGTANSYTIQSAISGSFNVGVGQTYADLTAAITDLNSKIITGPVTFLLTDASYSTGAGEVIDAFPLTINANGGSSSTNTVTFKPASGVTVSISSAAASTALFIVNGADWIIFDGSNNGTSSRDMTITNTNAGTSSAVIWLQTAGSDGATNNTVKNLNLVGNSNTTTLFGVGSGSSTISTTSLGTGNNSNTIQNNNISKTQNGIYSQGASAANKNTGTVISQNLINTASPNNVAKVGIMVGFENNITISQNSVDGMLQTSSPDVFGISLGISAISTSTFTGNEVTNATVTRNFVGVVKNTGTFSAAGIAVAPTTTGTNLIANNMVSGVFADGTSGDFSCGIFVGGGAGGTTNIYFNSVSMSTPSGAPADGSDKSYALAIGGSNPIVDMRNNILSNTQNVGTTVNYDVGYGYSTFTNLTSDYNDFFNTVNATHHVGATGSISSPTNQTTFANLQTATAKDANSKNVDPVFVSASDLHVQGTTTLGGQGIAIGGITIDFDGQTRANPPFIGADEIPASPGTLQFSSATYSVTEQAITATITVTRASGSQGAASVMYNVTDGSAMGGASCSPGIDYLTTSGTLNWANGDSANKTFTVTVCNDGVSEPSETVNLALSGETGATLGSPNTAVLTIINSEAFNGSYTVGAGGNYPSLTGPNGVITALNNGYVTGPVVFNLIENSNAPEASETYPIAINAISGASSTNTITIKPASGSTVTIAGASATGVFKLNGADWVIIDGSNNGTSSRDLTITNNNSSGVGVWIASASASDGATNNVVKNANISGSTGVVAIAGILSGSGTTLGNDAEAPNSNNTIQNNNIFRCQGALYLRGNTTTVDQNWLVTGNTFGSTLAADKLTFRGMLIGNSQAFTISNNTIRGVVFSGTSSTAGILTALTINGGTISGNQVSDVKNTNTGTYGAYGIEINTGTNVVVKNNFVYDINHDMTGGLAFSPSFGVFGIILDAGTGHQVIGNSVNLSGLQAGTTNSSLLTAAFAMVTTASTGCDVRDNIFANNITGGSTSIAHVSVYLPSGGTSAMNLAWNNNAYYNGTDAARQGLAQVGTTAGTGFFLSSNFNPGAITPASNFRSYSSTLSAAGTNDNASFASTGALPFISSSNLHLGSHAVAPANAGTPIGTLTDDIDSNARSATKPDIGADEIASNKLSALALSMGTLVPVFDPDVDSYTASVSNAVSSITVTPTEQDSNGVITVNGDVVASGSPSNPIALNTGNNTITVVVTPEFGPFSPSAGTPKTYTVVVNRAQNANADLSDLTLSDGTLTPAFDSGTTSYTASVPNATSSMTVTPTAAVPATSTIEVQVNGGGFSTVPSGMPSGSLALNVGANTIDVRVTAEAGNQKTYTVTVTRAANANADLSDLTLSDGTLSPAFDSGTTSYTASVANATSSITVTPTAAVPATSTIEVRVNGGSYTVVPSGMPSGSLALNVGANTVDVRVTAQAGNQKTYTVTVTRAPSSNANLSNLTLSDGTLNPVFDPNTTSYTANVPNSTSSITVTPTSQDSTSTIQVRVNGGSYTVVPSGMPSGSLALNVGSNTVDVLVTAQDEMRPNRPRTPLTNKTYTVTVTRAASANADLSNLTLSDGTLAPPFASGTTSYTATVPNATSSMTVTPTAADAGATIEVRVNGGSYTVVPSGMPSGSLALNVGDNPIDVRVTAADTTTIKIYTVTVHRSGPVTTNGGSGLAPDYASLAAAITALNGATMTSPVIITLNGNETAPAGGYSITQSGGTSTNTIVIQGNSSTITAGVGVSTTNDAIFKLIGADWVTLQNFTMQESAGNVTTTTQAEWGVALLYATTTNGAQNNTIQNNTISLNRTNPNTFGIYSNTRHTATAVTVTAEATTAAGANSNNKVYANAISNVNYGVVFVGCGTNIAAIGTGNDIGGSSAATGNVITNWGNGAAISSYVSVTGSNFCVYFNQQINDNISFNTITSAAGLATAAVQHGGILKAYSVASPTVGTVTTTNLNDNTVTINNSPTTGQMTGITAQGMTTLGTATINMNNNLVSGSVGSGATSATFLGLFGTSAPGTLSISNNTVRGVTTAATTGGFVGIQQQTGAVVNTLNLNNNHIGDATAGAVTFTTAAHTGTVGGIIVTSTGGAATAALSMTGNDFRGIVRSVVGAGAETYMSNAAPTLSQNISNNTFTNLTTNTTGNVTFISNGVSLTAAGTKNINGNQIVTAYNKTAAGGQVNFYADGGLNSPNGSVSNANNNNFSNVTVTGATTIGGWINVDGLSSTSAPAKTFTGNTFNNITGGTALVQIANFGFSGSTGNLSNNTISNVSGGGNITGIVLSSDNNNMTVSQNSIFSLSTTGAAVINPILHSAATTGNVFKNKIYDLSASNAGGSVNGIQVGGGTTVNVFNNLIGDLRAPAANTANALIGINVAGGTTVNAHYNTVYLNATSSGSPFGSSALSASTTPTLTLRNNVLVNTSTAAGTGLTAAYRRSSATLTTYGSGSNNNDFYAGVPGANNVIFTDGATSDQTIAAYKARVATRDSASFTENPTFLSTSGASANFLHIDSSVATHLESGAANVAGVTDDFDMDIRQGNPGYAGTGTAPDVGADEFGGIVLAYNANLSNLTLSDGTLNPAFDPNTTSYTATVANSTTSITETPTAQDSTSTITVNGNPVASGTASGPIALAVGPNVITTVVTAQDGTTMKTYTVTVTREALVSFSIDDVTMNEGNSGDTMFTFTVTKTGSTAFNSSVQFQTMDGSATVADNDYDPISGSLSFLPSDTMKQVTVMVNGDTTFEPNEVFTLELFNAVNATISDASGNGNITNDDARPPATTVYVDDDWAAVPCGQDPDMGGPATEMCYDAFSTIQAAINGVANPGTVIVYAGNYFENPSVNKALNIMGPNAGIPGSSGSRVAEAIVRTVGAAQTAVVSVSSHNVSLNGFTLDGDDPGFTGTTLGSGEDTNASYGVRPSGNNHIVVRDNIIKRVAIGFRGDGSSSHNLITENLFDSIGFFDFGYAVSLRTGYYADVTSNKMTRVWTGVHTNNFSAAIPPAAGELAPAWSISGNEIHYYAAGILYWLQFNNATSPIMNGNVITAEAAAVANNFGVLMVTVQSGVSPTFTNNVISGSDYGIGLTNTSTSNVITLGATNSIAGTELAGVYLTDNLTFNPVGTTDLTTNAYTGAANNIAVKVQGMPIDVAGGPAVEVVNSRTMAPDVVSTADVNGSSLTGPDAPFAAAPESAPLTYGVFVSGSFATANVSKSIAAGFDHGLWVDATNSGANPVTLTVTNSTVTGNTASSGGVLNATGVSGTANVTLTNSTFVSSSSFAGISLASANLTTGNSIFKAGSGANVATSGTTAVTSLGYNLSSDAFAGLLAGTGDQVNTDPMLGPLQNNGGPTFTHAPLVNSPALDQGKDTGPFGPSYTPTAEDQRGSVRPYDDPAVVNAAGGDGSDIGAVELQANEIVHATSADSRKTHGAAGDFDVNLPFSGPVGIECRSGPAGVYKIVVTFPSNVTYSSAQVIAGNGTVSNTSGSGTSQLTIDLSAVTDIQTLTLALFDVNDGVGNADIGLRMRVRIGDVTANDVVNSSDVSAVKAEIGNPVSGANFRSDVNANGVINSSDAGLTKSKIP